MRRLLVLIFAGLLVAGMVACGDEPMMDPNAGTPRKKKDAGAGKKGQDAGAPDAAMPVMEFTESDFVESEENRDPFRSFASMFVERASTERVVQRKVRASQFSLEELKLTGIISRGQVRAMLTDPQGLGWVLRPGDYVGKAELVSAGGPMGEDVAINWRVDRIRDDDVVFLRESPTHPEIPPATRIMHLHPVDENRPTG